MEKVNNRIEIIDALRGLSVLLMVAHHLLHNLVAFLGAPTWMFSNPVFDILQPFFAGVFIFLSGVSSRFSHSNIKRGLIAMAIAIVITVVTSFMNMPIIWGVLHLLAFCMLFYGLTSKIWDKIPEAVMPYLFVSLIIIGAISTSLISIMLTDPIPWIRDMVSILGWRQRGFISFDFFPIIPWLFVFLLGTWAGIPIKAGKLPQWFYNFTVPFFPMVGRKALIIYIIHQPILYGLIILITAVNN